MVYGAAATGRRAMTGSSGPGISLKQEGISYLAGTQLPAVVVDIMRAGPGLGGILPSQADYRQATKGAGHGDYRLLVLAPSTVQEAADLMMEAFDLADTYRNPVMLLGDGLIGQMMEPVEFRRRIEPADLPQKSWATTGAQGRVAGKETERLGQVLDYCSRIGNFALVEKLKGGLTVRLAHKKIRFKDLWNAQGGYIINFSKRADDPIDILFGNTVFAHAQVVEHNDQLGAKITEVVK
jgi:flagellar motor switch/type III secretory pathway protein FliN